MRPFHICLECIRLVRTYLSFGKPSARAGQNPRRTKAEWGRLHGPERAKICASTLPARPLRGRWGAVTRTEQFILKSSRSELCQVFEALGNKRAAKPAKPGIDIEAESERLKLGRWLREVIESLHSDFFWGNLYLANASRAPLDHFHSWIQKPLKEGELPKLATLVFFKATSIAEEFELLVDARPYYDIWSELLETVEGRDEESWIAGAVEVS